MVCLSWKYSVNVDIDQTVESATKNGLKVIWLYGQSRTHHEEYPLHQIKLVGQGFDPRLKIQVSPATTEFFFEVDNPFQINEIEKVLCAVEDAERTLNLTVVFSSGETRRFGLETKKPITSIPMLKIQMDLEHKQQEMLDKILEFFYSELSKSFADFYGGNFYAASVRLNRSISELKDFHESLVETARKLNDPRADEYEANLAWILADPFNYRQDKFHSKLGQ
jgi:hypothetical protein